MKFKTKFAAITAALIVAATLAFGANTLYSPGTVATSLNAVAATGAGDSFQFVPTDRNYQDLITWQMSYTGTPTAITTNLEGSVDFVNWYTLDTSTSTTNELRHVANKPVLYVRCNIAAYTVNGSTATCRFLAVRQ